MVNLDQTNRAGESALDVCVAAKRETAGQMLVDAGGNRTVWGVRKLSWFGAVECSLVFLIDWMARKKVVGINAVWTESQLCCNKMKLCPWKEFHGSCEYPSLLPPPPSTTSPPAPPPPSPSLPLPCPSHPSLPP